VALCCRVTRWHANILAVHGIDFALHHRDVAKVVQSGGGLITGPGPKLSAAPGAGHYNSDYPPIKYMDRTEEKLLESVKIFEYNVTR